VPIQPEKGELVVEQHGQQLEPQLGAQREQRHEVLDERRSEPGLGIEAEAAPVPLRRLLADAVREAVGQHEPAHDGDACLREACQIGAQLSTCDARPIARRLGPEVPAAVQPRIVDADAQASDAQAQAR
jgi:hypothetical protein